MLVREHKSNCHPEYANTISIDAELQSREHGDRASEAADRQAAADAVRAQVGEAGAADRTAGTAAGRAADSHRQPRRDRARV